MQNIAIFGVPRSGTSWLGQIFNSSPHVAYRYQPIFAYSFSEVLDEKSSWKEINSFHKKLLATDDEFVCQKKNISGNQAPSFHKEDISHLVWKEVRYLNIIENLIKKSSIKIVGIVRHPCGVLKSWMQTPKEFNADWSIQEEWRHAENKNSGDHDFYGYERWLQASQAFIRLENKYPKQFKSVAYESLLTDLSAQIKSLFEFTNLPITSQTQQFLKESTMHSSDDPYDVYRKEKSGDEWESELPSPIIDEILNDERFSKIHSYFHWGKV